MTEIRATKAGDYARQFYALLVEKSSEETIENEDSSVSVVRVYRGKLMELFNSMGVSDNFYSRIRRILLDYGCVTYLERGTKSYDTVLVLNHPPPQEIAPEHLTGTREGATLADIPDLERRLRVIEEKIVKYTTGGIDIAEVLKNFEGRITTLEMNRRENGKQTPKSAKKST